MYKSHYNHIDKFDLNDAIKLHNDLCYKDKLGLSYFEDIDDFKLTEIKTAIISMAKIIAELQEEWC